MLVKCQEHHRHVREYKCALPGRGSPGKQMAIGPALAEYARNAGLIGPMGRFITESQTLARRKDVPARPRFHARFLAQWTGPTPKKFHRTPRMRIAGWTDSRHDRV